MTKTDLRLEYQKQTGDSLATIYEAAENNDTGTQEYIDWLEERLIAFLIYAKVRDQSNARKYQ